MKQARPPGRTGIPMKPIKAVLSKHPELVLAAACEAFLHVLLYASPEGTLVMVYVKEEIDFIKVLGSVVGICVLLFILVKFTQRYLGNRNDTRFTVLVALVMFLTTVSLVVVESAWKFTGIQGRLLNNGITFALALSIFYLDVFGFHVLIAPGSERVARTHTRIMQSLYIAVLAVYVAKEVIDISSPSAGNPLSAVAEYSQYVVMAYALAVLVVTMVRSLALVRRTTDKASRSGIQALGTSFAIILACILLILANELIEATSYLDTAATLVSIAAFAAIYFGLIKPAGIAPREEGNRQLSGIG
ncbi:MAG: hypothetical protein JW839_01110 [Candidatus Lokiarchaeota archaeon]|nr:hypothetical protein [Candidatus Lokiarchaeota archaeon]